MTPIAQSPSRRPIAALVLIVVVAAAFRLWQTRESLWVDELHTAWCVNGNLAEVAPRAAIGNQSPIFYWLQWFFVHLLGMSEFILRLPSVLAGSLLPVALFALAYRWTKSSGVGLIAAALVAVDPMSIFFATEARPYGLVQLLAVTHVACFAELVSQPTRLLRLAFVLGAALQFHLHYTAALLLAAEIAYWAHLAFHRRSDVGYGWHSLMLDLVVVGLLCLPASAHLLAIFSRRTNWESFVTHRQPWELLDLLPWSGSALFILAACLMNWLWQLPKVNDVQQRDRVFSIQLLALCWLLVPLLVAWLTTATDVARLFFPRYLAASAPAAMLLAALSVSLAPYRWARIALGAGVIVTAMWISGVVDQFRYDGRLIGSRNEDWRGAVAWLNEQLLNAPYPLLVASGLIEADALRQLHDQLLENYCLLPVTSMYAVTALRAELVPLPYRNAGQLEKPVRQLVTERRGAWVIIRGTKSGTEQVLRQLLGDFDSNWDITAKRDFGNVHLSLIEQHPPEP